MVDYSRERSFTIAHRRVADATNAFVVAEVGSNHQGNPQLCMDLIKAAAVAGASAVKLQRRHNPIVYTAAMYDAPYTSSNAYGPTYGAHREALELSKHETRVLFSYAHAHDLIAFATPFDENSADELFDLGVPCFKIASGDLTNIPLIRHVAHYGLPVLLSTGAASLEDVDRAVACATRMTAQVAILHCTAEYPCPPEHLNLHTISLYRARYPLCTIGLSSHFSGIEDAVIAYTLGARIFEKHFTLDRTFKGTDHAFSLEPAGLAKMVSYLHKARLMLGEMGKPYFTEEVSARHKMGKTLRAARDLASGHELTETDIVCKSPGTEGLPPYRLDDLLGTVIHRPMHADDPFVLSDLYTEV
jgi:sialic acid synthase